MNKMKCSGLFRGIPTGFDCAEHDFSLSYASMQKMREKRNLHENLQETWRPPTKHPVFVKL